MENGYFNYGAPQGNPYYEEKPPVGNGLAVAALVCGLLGLFCCGFPAGIAGIVCGAIDRKKRGRFDGMALAGLICGIVATVLGLLGVVLYIVIFAELMNDPEFIESFSAVLTTAALL